MKNHVEDEGIKISQQKNHLHNQMFNLSENIQIMGIMNMTPDSFYRKSQNKYTNKQSISSQLEKISNSDIIDVGAESSRPGATPVSSDEEILRLHKIIPLLTQYDKIEFSIDTYKPKTASFALENGFSIINDISGGKSMQLLDIVAENNAKLILMHMQGTPINMQKNPSYTDVIEDIIIFFEKQSKRAINSGISQNKIILDPGIGFGKTTENNDKIITNLSKLKSLGFQVLIGVSRKSFLQQNNDSPIDRLPATIAANTISILNGADIIRVHDVDEHIKIRSILSRMNKQFLGKVYGY